MPNSIMVVAEAPGQHESFLSHRPLTGKSGQLFDTMVSKHGLYRENWYITNIVKCNPPDNRTPTAEEVERCSFYLRMEVAECEPRAVVTMGAVSTNWFVPGAPPMDYCWGIPTIGNEERAVFPMYHPAHALHQPRMLTYIDQGFSRLGRWLSGSYNEWEPDTVIPDYQEVMAFSDEWYHAYAIGLDTETTWDGTPLFIQVSYKKGEAYLVDCRNKEALSHITDLVENTEAVIVVHNAPFDLEVLHRLDIHPRKVVDTMVMSYLLQDLPQGLKPLAYRLAGMKMRSYGSMVKAANIAKAREYLDVVAALEWPDPAPVLEMNGTEFKIRKPQNINRKVTRALADFDNGKEVDLYDRWTNMEGREVVESVLGHMPRGDLCSVPAQEALDYACKDADATRRVYSVLRKEIANRSLEGVLAMDMGIVPMVLEMQREGIAVDREVLAKLSIDYQRKMDIISGEIEGLLGYGINPGSDDQVRAMIEKERIPIKVKKTRGGKQTTGAGVLKPLERDYPVIKKVLAWREVETLKSTFTDKLPKLIGDDGRVRPTIKMTRTTTGRLATADPNLQNIPAHSEEGKQIRKAFIVEPGWTLVSADYSQIELRILAHESGDERMIEAFLSGVDLHSATASEMFGIPIDKLDKDKHRTPAKRVNFGIPYGITAVGLLGTMEKDGALGWTEAKCQDLIDRWFMARPKCKTYMARIAAMAESHGYVRDMWGRIRLIPEVMSEERKVRADGIREAMNMPIQAGAQGVIKLAMGKLWADFLADNLDIVRPWMQIHDSLEFKVRDTELDWVIPIIKSIMENVVRLTIPTPVDIKQGVNWGEMEGL